MRWRLRAAEEGGGGEICACMQSMSMMLMTLGNGNAQIFGTHISQSPADNSMDFPELECAYALNPKP